jgi:hypothetical protein
MALDLIVRLITRKSLDEKLKFGAVQRSAHRHGLGRRKLAAA